MLFASEPAEANRLMLSGTLGISASPKGEMACFVSVRLKYLNTKFAFSKVWLLNVSVSVLIVFESCHAVLYVGMLKHSFSILSEYC